MPGGAALPDTSDHAEEVADARNGTVDLTLGVHQDLVDVPNSWLSAP